MLSLRLTGPAEPRRLVVIGAHSDDAEIGCGGTVLSLLAAYPGTAVTWVVLTGDGEREAEARRSAEALLGDAGSLDIVFGGLRDAHLPSQWPEAKQIFEGLKAADPDIVLTHQRHDLHQDHRVACELTWNTFRNHTILEYEVPKWDGDLGAPNVLVPLHADLVARKVAHLIEHFASQRSKRWFTADLFEGLMRIRGMECVSDSGFAEAFYARKLAFRP